MVAAHGKVIAQGDRFSFRDFVITDAVIDLEQIRTEFAARSTAFTVTEDNRESLVDCGDLTLANRSEVPTSSQVVAEWESSAELKCEEFARACSLGMFDYLRKSRHSSHLWHLPRGLSNEYRARH